SSGLNHLRGIGARRTLVAVPDVCGRNGLDPRDDPSATSDGEGVTPRYPAYQGEPRGLRLGDGDGLHAIIVVRAERSVWSSTSRHRGRLRLVDFEDDARRAARYAFG